jgi:hypothetical protein
MATAPVIGSASFASFLTDRGASEALAAGSACRVHHPAPESVKSLSG